MYCSCYLVVIATGMSGAHMYSTVKIGASQILGEIIKINGNEATIQCFDSTSTIQAMQMDWQLAIKCKDINSTSQSSWVQVLWAMYSMGSRIPLTWVNNRVSKFQKLKWASR